MLNINFTEHGIEIFQNHYLSFIEEIKVEELKLFSNNNKNKLPILNTLISDFNKYHQFIEYSIKRDNRPKIEIEDDIKVHFVDLKNNVSYYSIGASNVWYIVERLKEERFGFSELVNTDYLNIENKLHAGMLNIENVINKLLPLDINCLYNCVPFYHKGLKDDICYIKNNDGYCLPLSFLVENIAKPSNISIDLYSNMIQNDGLKFKIDKANECIAFEFSDTRMSGRNKVTNYQGKIDIQTFNASFQLIETGTYSIT